MRLSRKLVLFSLAAATAPLVGVAFAVLAGAQRTLAARIAAEQLAAARGAAEAISSDLGQIDVQMETLLGSFDPGRLDDAERRGALALLRRQLRPATAVALVGADGVADVLADDDGAGSDGRAGAGAEALLHAVREGVAASAAGRGGLAITAYDDPEHGRRLSAVRGGPAPERWYVAARLDVEPLRRRLETAGGSAGGAYLLDGGGEVVASSGAALAPEARSALAALGGPAPRTAVLPGPDGPALAAWAPLPRAPGWGVAMRLPAADAYAEVSRMRRAVLLASLAVLAVVLGAGVVLARGLVRGLGRIDGAARALAAGDLSVRLPSTGGDEVAAVSRTFNAMAEELSAARDRLERWNEELQGEVEARTRELKEAQARLLEAQKLAAIGQLGAGVAHEINNPLTGILGHAQLLLEADRSAPVDHQALERIEALARRCRNVTENLLRFSQQRSEPDFQDVDLNRAVADALALAEGQIRGEGIAVAASLAEPAPRVRGDPGHLAQVALNLISNARTACLGRPGRTIRIETRRTADGAEILVRDDGKGIPPEVIPRIFEPFFTTKDVWSNVGLGLSVAYRIVSEHGGRIQVDSRPGEGSTFTVALPAAVAR
jgi:two-component system, NtrC family, sensor kinase